MKKSIGKSSREYSVKAKGKKQIYFYPVPNPIFYKYQ